MAKKIDWAVVKEVVDNQLGKDSFRQIEGKNLALIFYEKHQLAILKEDESGANLHFRASASPRVAAWIACVLRSCCSFTIMSLYEISEDGEFINESEMDDEIDEDEDIDFDDINAAEEDDNPPQKINRNLMH
jgi:hypothetical protein